MATTSSPPRPTDRLASDSTVVLDGSAAVVRPRSLPARRRSRGTRAEAVVTGPVVWVAYAGLILGALATVICEAHTPELAPENQRLFFERMLAGPLAELGPDIHLAGVIVVFTFMWVCYATLVRFGARLPARAIVAGIVAVHLLMAVAPPVMSTDVFSYGAYGRMGTLYGINPYLNGPFAIFGDNYYSLIGAQWGKMPTAYGPLFTGISYLFGHLSIEATTYAYKLLTVACSLIAIAGVARAAQRLGHDAGRAALFIGLNPVLIVYAVGGSHNDMIMLAGMCWSIAALVAHRARTAGGTLVLAVSIKLTAAVMLPFALAARQPAPGRASLGHHHRRLLAGAAIVFLAVGIFSTILFGSGPLHLLSTLEVIQSNGGRQSIPGFIPWALGLGRLPHAVVIALQLIFALVAVRLIVAVRRHRMDWITATGWAVVALLITSTFMLPWYLVWVLPFAALSDSRRLRYATLVLTAILMTSL